MKKLILSLLFISVITSLKAQQEALYSQYMFNTLGINPAYAGNRDVLSLTALGRYQWVGVEGAPKSFIFTADMPFRNESMGLGLSIYSDEVGLQKNLGGNLAYSYKVRIGENSTLSFGLQGGVSNIKWQLSQVQNVGNDPVFAGANDINRFFPAVGGGLFLASDIAYLGFSVPNFIEQDYASQTNASGIKRHYYTMAGIVLGKGMMKVKPSTLVRYTKGAGFGADLNVNVWFNDVFSIGLSGRKSQMIAGSSEGVDALVGMLEFQFTPQFRLGYAYDYTMSHFNAIRGGKSFSAVQSHEVLLRYEFGFNKKKILTPRYF